ncbi:MAG TPA: hypothetical protein VHW00_21630 [Thermoanaerobaculia bacterium]|nr:hypothetical protein [Thermoanaerobaculia bacterium]
MTLYRIEHALVMDTDDVPGRGGYAVTGISPRVSPAERSFIAGNFGISDYLHDPKTENRIFYAVFRIPGGRRAFVRRFARGTELRRNNTQRRLVVHTLLLDDDVWQELHALPWLLLNASVRLEGATSWDRLRADVPWTDDGSTLPALEWDSSDGAAANAWKRLTDRLGLIEHGEPRDLIARILTAMSARARVALPQDAGWEWATMLAWSMLPRHDRDDLGWTQHDSMNLTGIAFALANVPGGDFHASQVQPANFAHELVQMNVESERSWLDLQGRTSRHPLSVRHAGDLEKWGKWRNALLDLHTHIRGSEDEVVRYMRKLALTVKANPRATWIDAEEVLRLVWSNVAQDIRGGDAVAVTRWGQRLRESGLADVVFGAVPAKHWLNAAANDIGSDALVWFFLSGGGEDESARGARAAIAEWLVETRLHGVTPERATMLAQLLSNDYARPLVPLLEQLLATPEGLAALIESLGRREHGGLELLHAAAPIVVARAHPNAREFLRDLFVPRFERTRIDAKLARAIALLVRDDAATLLQFLARVPTDVAGPVAMSLAQAGQPASVWLDVLLRMAKSIDEENDAGGARDFAEMMRALTAREPLLDGAMSRFIDFVATERPRARESMRSIVALLRPVWPQGGSKFGAALIALLQRAPNAIAWEELVVAYANEQRAKRPDDVSELASVWWCLVEPDLATRSGALLDVIRGDGLRRLTAHWSKKVGTLSPSPVADKLLALVQHHSDSFEVERDLASRDVRHGVANVQTLNRLEAALARVHAAKGSRLFVDDARVFLGDGPATRAVRLLKVLSSDDVHPTVRLAFLQHLLPEVLASLRKGDFEEVKQQTREEDLLGLGVVVRLAYAVGARASGSTSAGFEAVWVRNKRSDALDALQAGRATRGPLRWLTSRMRSDGPVQM